VVGDDLVKRLWKDQEVVIQRDFRTATEAMVRGRYAIGIGAVDEFIYKEFAQQGLGKNLKPVDLDDFDTISYSDVLMYVNKAPHPNAAKLFINWIMTKEGQTLWTKWTETNSRRADVAPVNPDVEPIPGRRYGSYEGDGIDYDLRTRELAQEALK
jgi:iron(III) transport system substrate-binding protein